MVRDYGFIIRYVITSSSANVITRVIRGCYGILVLKFFDIANRGFTIL